MIPTIDNLIVGIPTINTCIKCYESVNEVVIPEIVKQIQNEDMIFLKGFHSIGLQKFIHYFGMNR